MQINDIFISLEGEGMNIGIPEIFIRFQGCTLGCKFCDTPEAKNPNGGINMSIDKIMEKVEELKCKRVVLTGGNPIEQNLDDLEELVIRLKNKKYFITLEATGCDKISSHLQDIFNKIDFISFDIKSPSSKIDTIFDNGSIGWLWKSQYKIIVSNDEDYIFAKKMIEKYVNGKYNFIITPCWNIKKDIDKKFVQKIWSNVVRDKLRCRVIIQQHKIAFGAEKRGV